MNTNYLNTVMFISLRTNIETNIQILFVLRLMNITVLVDLLYILGPMV